VGTEGVLVLGMHRSGTSLVAGSLHRLGLAVCASEDLLTGMPWNPAGHFESRSLSRLNEELLAETGRSWWYPPPPGRQYAEFTSRLLTTPAAAAGRFRRTHTTAPWVWKDPRLALLLPFWRQALGEVAAVLVHRDPLEVARSLELRNGFPTPFGTALWARYNRLLLEQCGGLAVLVVGYDDLVEEPDRWADAAAAFLDSLGLAVRPGAPADAGAFVQPALRHVGRGGVGDVSDAPAGPAGMAGMADTGDRGERDLALEVAHLASVLRASEGVHASFVPPALEDERPAVEAELSARWPDLPPAWNDPPWSAAAARRPLPANAEGDSH
jgi:Sulfotransferase family